MVAGRGVGTSGNGSFEGARVPCPGSGGTSWLVHSPGTNEINSRVGLGGPPMALSAQERKEIADLATRALAVVDQMLLAYTQLGGVRHRFGLGVYDASEAGAAFDPASI